MERMVNMKYKPGDKFIIEIERCIENCAPPNYRMKKCFFSLSETSLCNLEPYSKEAEYQRGLDDAWEASRRILLLKASDVGTVFNMPYWFDVFKNYSAQEAIAKLCAYEEAQEIHVGDEVETVCEKFVVTLIGNDNYFGVEKGGALISANKNYCKKTGRRFPEVAALLKKNEG